MAATEQETAQAWVDRARDYWRKQGSGLTHVRKIVCEVILNARGTFNAETLLSLCRERDRAISLSTIYRTLNHLVEAELLDEVDGVDDRHHYKVRNGPDLGESVVVCLDCGTIFPVENPCLGLRESEPLKRMGFAPKRIRLRAESHCESYKETGACDRKDAPVE